MGRIIIINNAVIAITCVISAIKLHSAYRRSQSAIFLDFIKFYFYITIFIIFFTLAVPELFFKNNLYYNLSLAVSRLFVFIGAAYFVRVPLGVLQRKTLANLIFRIYLFFGITMSAASFFLPHQPGIIEIDQARYFTSTENPILSAAIGILLSIICVIIIYFFIANGIRSKDSAAKTRSFLIVMGMFVLLIAVSIHFTLKDITSITPLAYTAATGLGWIGFLTILAGILFKNKEGG